VLTVGLAADPTKTVTLDDTLESFTLGLSDDIHRITLLKEGHIHLVAQLKVLFETTEFGYLGLGACAGFLEVTNERLGRGFLLAITKSQLNSFVPILVLGADLRYNTGACLQNGTRNHCTIRRKDGGHSNFFTNYT